MPQSAATIASFRSSFSDEPAAESTPPIHAITHDYPAPAKRRSSIVYIKSDENSPPTPDTVDRRRLSGRLSGGNRPLATQNRNMAGPSIKESKIPGPDTRVSPTGLKRLSLLQQRDMNVMPSTPEVDEPSSDFSMKSGIRPLNLTRKYKAKGKPSPGYDGVTATSTPRNLVRSATSKDRGVLRKDEVLPDVVVRPPSQSEDYGFSYSFR